MRSAALGGSVIVKIDFDIDRRRIGEIVANSFAAIDFALGRVLPSGAMNFQCAFRRACTIGRTIGIHRFPWPSIEEKSMNEDGVCRRCRQKGRICRFFGLRLSRSCRFRSITFIPHEPPASELSAYPRTT